MAEKTSGRSVRGRVRIPRAPVSGPQSRSDGTAARRFSIQACTAGFPPTSLPSSPRTSPPSRAGSTPKGSLEQTSARADAVAWREDAGIAVVNPPRAIERTVDKFYTSALLERAGLATPQTVVCERVEDAAATFRSMGDVIVKPLFGSMGLGMVRVSDEETAWRVFRALEASRGVYYLQRAIPHAGRDIRAFVVGDRVVAGTERRPPGWRTNIPGGEEERGSTRAEGRKERGASKPLKASSPGSTKCFPTRKMAASMPVRTPTFPSTTTAIISPGRSTSYAPR